MFPCFLRPIKDYNNNSTTTPFYYYLTVLNYLFYFHSLQSLTGPLFYSFRDFCLDVPHLDVTTKCSIRVVKRHFVCQIDCQSFRLNNLVLFVLVHVEPYTPSSRLRLSVHKGLSFKIFNFWRTCTVLMRDETVVKWRLVVFNLMYFRNRSLTVSLYYVYKIYIKKLHKNLHCLLRLIPSSTSSL